MHRFCGEAYELVNRLALPGGWELDVKEIGYQCVSSLQVVSLFLPKDVPESVVLELEHKEPYRRLLYHLLFAIVYDKKNWKNPTTPLITESLDTAMLVARAITYFTGGCWVIRSELKGKPIYVVWSKGYYHYIGP